MFVGTKGSLGRILTQIRIQQKPGAHPGLLGAPVFNGDLYGYPVGNLLARSFDKRKFFGNQKKGGLKNQGRFGAVPAEPGSERRRVSQLIDPVVAGDGKKTGTGILIGKKGLVPAPGILVYAVKGEAAGFFVKNQPDGTV
jgi:hypothetical protein